MKYYIAYLSTRDGDHEYGDQFSLETENEQAAEEKAKKYLLNVYADPDDDSFDKNDQLDLFDQIVEFGGVTEVSKRDFDVLRKYL
jgi:hypothetical protein